MPPLPVRCTFSPAASRSSRFDAVLVEGLREVLLALALLRELVAALVVQFGLLTALLSQAFDVVVAVIDLRKQVFDPL